MPKFAYKIVTKENKIVEGALPAVSEAAARKTLETDGFTVISLSRDKEKSIFRRELVLPGFAFAKPDQILFYRNCATMISAGLSIVEALKVLEEQQRSSKVKAAIETIIREIENGQRLSSAMKKFPKYFSDYIVETINVGEVTGRLADTIDRISVDLEHDYELTRKVRGAMAYPIVVIVVLLLVVVGLTSFVLPKVADLFEELHAELPLPTRILLGGSAFVRDNPLIIAGILAAAVISLYAAWRNKKGRHIIHFVFLKLPIFGDLAREFNLARFFRGLESLFVSGVSLVRSVEISKKTLRNDVYRDALDRMHPSLMQGTPLTQVLEPHPFLFPTQTRRMVGVGERTGKLDEIFVRITAYYERSLNHKTQMLASLIEPVLIVVIGVVVGGLAISVFMPIYQASDFI